MVLSVDYLLCFSDEDVLLLKLENHNKYFKMRKKNKVVSINTCSGHLNKWGIRLGHIYIYELN